MNIQRYKVFLASSAELSQERKAITETIQNLNRNWTEEKGIILEPVIWEDLITSFRGGGQRIQDYFNMVILDCDIVFVLYDKKIGPFTEEEFLMAIENLRKGKKPHFLFMFFKSGAIPVEATKGDLAQILKLKQHVQSHKDIYGEYHSTKELTELVESRLARVISEKQETPRLNEVQAQTELENYQAVLRKEFRYEYLYTLMSGNHKTIDLEALYVKLKVKESTAGPLPSRRTEFDAVFKELYNKKKKSQHPLRMVILGHPGSGKTTLLKMIALQCMRAEENGLFSLYTPVFIPLIELDRNSDNSFRHNKILDWVSKYFRSKKIPVDSFLERRMKENRLLYLLDGLDEIDDKQKRKEVIDWIQKQEWGQNPLIVTSRYSGLNKGETFLDDFSVYEIQEFDIHDMENFLKNWANNVDVSEKRNSQDVVAQLMPIITANSNLQELVMNPLLLTILAIDYSPLLFFPEGRDKIVDFCLYLISYLWNRIAFKSDQNFFYKQTVPQFSKIATLLMESGKREIEQREIEKALPESIEGLSRHFFLDELISKAGILYESNGKIGFKYLIFQEYLAADFYAKSWLSGSSIPDNIINHLTGFIRDERWHEVLYFILKPLKPEQTHEILNRILARCEPPPLYLKSIEIEDVKCFKGKHLLNLSKKKGKYSLWTIILGNNGTGKTTLLQAMAKLDPLLLKENTRLSDINPQGNQYEISLKENGDSPFKRITGKIYRDVKNIPPPLKFVLNNAHFFPTGGSDNESANQFIAPVIYAYGASRKSGDAALTDSEMRNRFDNIFKDANLINVEEWLVQADYAEKKGNILAKENLDKIKRILLDVLPDVTAFDFKTDTKLRNYIEFITAYGSVPFKGLSLGYRVMISWVVDLVRLMFERYPNSPNPIAEPAIVLVDEIDLHLHPSWQREIVDFLSGHFPKTQFIVTTHSPLIVQSTDRINLILLQKDTDKTSVSITDFSGDSYYGWTLDEILEDRMGLDKTVSEKYSQLFTAFQEAITNEDIDKTQQVNSKLDKILHPGNHLRKIMSIQMAGIGGPGKK